MINNIATKQRQQDLPDRVDTQGNKIKNLSRLAQNRVPAQPGKQDGQQKKSNWKKWALYAASGGTATVIPLYHYFRLLS